MFLVEKYALSNLGRIEVKIKNYDKALNYFREALDVSRKSPRFLAFKKAKEKIVLFMRVTQKE